MLLLLLPLIGLSTFVTVGLTVLGIGVIMSVVFYLMYHTFHGDLPEMMKLIIGLFILVAGILIGVGLFF